MTDLVSGYILIGDNNGKGVILNISSKSVFDMFLEDLQSTPIHNYIPLKFYVDDEIREAWIRVGSVDSATYIPFKENYHE